MNARKYEKEYRRFGIKVRYFRIQRNMTQEELADAIGTDRQQIGRIERGEIGVSLDRILDLAEGLKLENPSLLLDFQDMLE